jgi:arginase
VAEVAARVAERVAAILDAHEMPLVLGGDCTIELGVLAGFLRHGADVGLLYLDAHVDLNTPATSPTGIFDGMGLAHIIGVADADETLSHGGPRYPLLPADRVVAFGYNPGALDEPEQAVLAQQAVLRYPVDAVAGRATDQAREALGQLEGRAGRLVVHFDVDVIDTTEFPLADWPQRGGLTFADAMACLNVFVASPACAALVITEINPDRAPAEHEAATALVAGIADALSLNGRPG